MSVFAVVLNNYETFVALDTGYIRTVHRIP
jgi:hypothetical protein